MRREFIYVEPYEKEYGHQVFDWKFEQEPRRVWTLFEGVERVVTLVPKHGVNAFLEDKYHDWCVMNGKFHYMSRFVGGGVWLLVEFG